MGKKILIFYTSVGLGHKSIAENIGWHLERAGFEVRLEDMLKAQNGRLVNVGKKIHNQLITNFSFVWDFLYNSKWFTDASLGFRMKTASKNYKQAKEIIDGFNPDIVIATETIPSAIVAFLKRQKMFSGKFGIAFSDFHLHRYWLYDQADFYLANIEEQKQEMVALGISSAKIFVCGMLLKPKNEVDIAATKNKFNIAVDDKVVLVASGSQGTEVDENLIAQFISQPKIIVIIACGKNKKLQERLGEKFATSNIRILGYYSPMDELYATADIFISKPGGLSVSEALRWRLPILISHLLPGQEKHNYDYLLGKGLVMPPSPDVVGRAMQELQTGAFRQGLKNNQELENLFNGRDILLQAINKACGEPGPY